MAEKISLHDRMANVNRGADFLIECLCTTSVAEVLDASNMQRTGRRRRVRSWMFTDDGTPRKTGEVLYEQRYDRVPCTKEALIRSLAAYYEPTPPSSASVSRQ